MLSSAMSEQHARLDSPLFNSPDMFANAPKNDQLHIHPLLMFGKSGRLVSSSASKSRRSGGFYHQEHLRSAAFTDLRLSRNGTVITARWTTVYGYPKRSSLDLDLHIGNIDGTLCWGYSDFRNSCTDFDLNGTIFSASCRPRSWCSPEDYPYSEIDLMEYLHISGGVLCVNNFANCRLTCKDTVITADWTTLQGIPKQFSLDLDRYIGNIDGALRWGEKDFSQSCISWDLRGTVFFASCYPRTWSAEGYQYSELDLQNYLQISEGMLCVINDVDPPSHADSPKPHSSPSKLSFNPSVPSTLPVHKPGPAHPVKIHPPAPSAHHFEFEPGSLVPSVGHEHNPPAPSTDPSEPDYEPPTPSVGPELNPPAPSVDPPASEVGPSEPQGNSSEPQDVLSKPQESSLEPRIDPPEPQDGFSKPQEGSPEPHVDSAEPQDGSSEPKGTLSKPSWGLLVDLSDPQASFSEPQEGSLEFEHHVDPSDSLDASSGQGVLPKPNEGFSEPEDIASESQEGSSESHVDSSDPQDALTEPRECSLEPHVDSSDPQDSSSEPQDVLSKPRERSSEPHGDSFDLQHSPSVPQDVPSLPQDSSSETCVIYSQPSVESWTIFMFRQLERMKAVFRLYLARLLGRK